MLELLPDLGALSAWVALLIIAAGLWVLDGLIRNSFGRVPVIGPWINRYISAALNDARNAVLKGAGSTWGVGRQLFRWMLEFARNPIGETIKAFAEVYSFGRRVVDVYIPEARTYALLWASDAVNHALATVRGWYDALGSEVDQIKARALVWFYEAINAAHIAQQNAVIIAGAHADAIVGGVYTDLEREAKIAVELAWPNAIPDIRALRDALGGDFPWLNDLLGALGGLGVAGLAGTLIQSLAGAQAVTKLATDCIVPNCRNISQFGQELQNLLAPASEAAMLAWLIFAITDPSGWAREMETVAAPIARDAANLVTTVTGMGVRL